LFPASRKSKRSILSVKYSVYLSCDQEEYVIIRNTNPVMNREIFFILLILQVNIDETQIV
jgi:hypothetical protein